MKHFAFPGWQNVMIEKNITTKRTKKAKSYIYIRKILIFVSEKHCLF